MQSPSGVFQFSITYTEQEMCILNWAPCKISHQFGVIIPINLMETQNAMDAQKLYYKFCLQFTQGNYF